MSKIEQFETDDQKSLNACNFETLSKEAPAIRERINRFRESLGKFFVDKQKLIDLMVVAGVAQEPLLLVGPPGTAKSDLVVKFRQAMQMLDEDYFEYMLTRFTEPSEILGPIDISLLRQGKYIRRGQGKLPTGQLVFLDEIFKSNSAILNSLLTIINERKFYQDGVPTPVGMKILFAATNEIPEHAELAALKDRFCLKAACRSVQDKYFVELLDAGLQSQTNKDLHQRPWAEGHASLLDFMKAHKYLTYQFGKTWEGPNGETLRDRDLFFKEDLLRELRRLLKTLVREDGITVSDRKVIKLYRLLRTRAWVMHGGAVERQDLQLLSYLGETKEEIDLLEEKVPKLLGL
jgi:MoxR-like ATPase